MTESAPAISREKSSAELLCETIKARFGDAIIEFAATHFPYIAVKPSRIREIARFLRDEHHFESLMCLSGLDTRGLRVSTKPIPADAPKGTKPEAAVEEFAVVYHLASMKTGAKIALRVGLGLENPTVPTVSDIWRVANWHEREAYDMFGIKFEGHPDLKRILCPDDWEGFPLRKDYKMPDHYRNIPHERRPSGAELHAGKNKCQ